jgi:NADH-quinone oxidoreductase subunit I
MNGIGILRGLWVTFRNHFAETYLEDFRGRGKRYFTEQGVMDRSSSDYKGIFTVQYPEEKLPVPEAFRYIPMLIYEEQPDGEKKYRCTSCGICSRVCPSQCIWIVRQTDQKTGRPLPSSAEFSIDIDLCMNCGLCAEFCPFDAIKMDHDYEIAFYDRPGNHIYDKEKLGKPVSYNGEICPTDHRLEEEAREKKRSAQLAAKS